MGESILEKWMGSTETERIKSLAELAYIANLGRLI